MRITAGARTTKREEEVDMRGLRKSRRSRFPGWHHDPLIVIQIRQCCRCLLLLLLVLLMQGPSMLVQQVAWAGMLVSYSQDQGIMRGVIETFDGEHPCSMCLKAADLREEEESKDRQRDGLRITMAWFHIPQGMTVVAPPAGNELASSMKSYAERHFSGRGRDMPPLPPPERVI